VLGHAQTLASFFHPNVTLGINKVQSHLNDFLIHEQMTQQAE
jgi:hypothetical protein